MKLENMMVCSVAYQLHVNQDGDTMLIDEANSQQPFTFLTGAGQVLPDFESNLIGKQVGDKVSFSISAENGYGVYSEQDIVAIPQANFKHPDTGQFDTDIVKVGKVIPLQDQDGNQFNGTVLAIENDMVTIDFNHPLAGKQLDFSVEVLNVREATQEELEHGHAHGIGGHIH